MKKTLKVKPTLRSPETQALYREYIETGNIEACPLCNKLEEVVKEFNHVQIVLNRFPYDRAFVDHHMVITKRHVSENDLNAEEIAELLELRKTYLNDNYTLVMEALPKKKSIPPHFHLHLVNIRPDWVA